tara:strand:- start:283 stop:387 length:105 start_codon:yes stop_codon:yes gene_type:complete
MLKKKLIKLDPKEFTSNRDLIDLRYETKIIEERI